jgi:isopentenyl-diphosphate delta-isomerase
LRDRKKEHIELALQSQTQVSEIDSRFYYEPMLSPHPTDVNEEFFFLGKIFRVPIWVSSMTGGTPLARSINTNLARACKEFGMGMGLGSCRALLADDRCFKDFDLRDTIGDDRALYANIGISQIEQALESGSVQKIHDMVARLRADGLIIHVNPIQEWVQPEGDRLKIAPIQTIERYLEKAPYKIIVKEVGQGMGRKSLEALMKLPLEAIEFAAFGGTNFAIVEIMRNKSNLQQFYEPFARVGVDAATMLEVVNGLYENNAALPCRQIIISGGIKTFLDGYYFISKSKLPSVYGQASAFLAYAGGNYDVLYHFVDSQVKGLKMAMNYLRVKE